MKKLFSFLLMTLTATFVFAEVEPIRLPPTRPEAVPAVSAAVPSTPAAKPGKGAKSKKHTKAHHKKKAPAVAPH